MMRIITVAVWCALALSPTVLADSFDVIKKDLSRPGCQYFEFVSLVHSEVFDSIDSASGTAYLASDGRYNVEVADDQYLCDGENRFSYNVGSNQVIIEPAGSGTTASEDFYFVVRLDDLYRTEVLQQNRRYRLYKREGAGTEYPDSMEVEIDSERNMLRQIEFYDINEDLNVIRFTNQRYFPQTDSLWFEPEFPDSVEKVKL